MSFPNDNLNVPARILFFLLPLGAMVAPLLKDADLEYANAVSRAGLEYVAFFLTALILYLSVAASEPWARLLSKDKTNIVQTRRASFIGAGICAVFVVVIVVLHR